MTTRFEFCELRVELVEDGVYIMCTLGTGSQGQARVVLMGTRDNSIAFSIACILLF